MGLDLTANYRLGTDLSLASAMAASGGYYGEVWGASGFRPVGSNAQQFTGSFDGQGHSISGLAINRAATDYVGLFGYTSGATLANVKLVGGNVTGRDNVGALVGYMQGGTLGNASASTTVNGTSTSEANTGGLDRHQRQRRHRRYLRHRQCHRGRLPGRWPGRLQRQRRQHHPLLCHR